MMKIRTMLVLLVMILLAVFLVINWGALSTPMTVNLVYTEVDAPLGAIVVASFTSVLVLLLVYTIWQQASVTLELRAASKEARHARDIADHAEKSRFSENSRVMTERIEKLEALLTARSDEVLTAVKAQTARIDEKMKELDGLMNGLSDIQKKSQAETLKELKQQLVAIEEKMVVALPKPEESAKEEAASVSEAEPEKKTEKRRFKDLF